MKTTTVEVANFSFGEDGEQLLQAPSLGASVGIGVYDPERRIGGLYSFIFPDSSQSSSLDPAQHPLIFADTGIKQFFEAAREKGIALENAKIAVCGGASFLDAFGGGNLGKRNAEAVCKLLAKARIKPRLVKVGGINNCSLELDLLAGVLRVEIYGEATKEI